MREYRAGVVAAGWLRSTRGGGHRVRAGAVLAVVALIGGSSCGAGEAGGGSVGWRLPDVRVSFEGQELGREPFELGELERGKVQTRFLKLENLRDGERRFSLSQCCRTFGLPERSFDVGAYGEHVVPIEIRGDILRGVNALGKVRVSVDPEDEFFEIPFRFTIPPEFMLRPRSVRLHWSPTTPSPSEQVLLTVAPPFEADLSSIAHPEFLDVSVSDPSIRDEGVAIGMRVSLVEDRAPSRFAGKVTIPIRGASPPYDRAVITVRGEGVQRYCVEPNGVIVNADHLPVKAEVRVSPVTRIPREARLRNSE